MRRSILIGVLALISAALCIETTTADIIHLKNGNSLEGEIKTTTKQQVTIDVPGAGKLTLERSEIASIEKAAQEGTQESSSTATVPQGQSLEATQTSSSWEELDRKYDALYQQRRYVEATAVAEQALKLAEQLFKPDDIRLASSLNKRAARYYDEGKYTEAEPFFKRALDIAEKNLKPDDPGLAQQLSNLGEAYRGEGKLDQAEPLLKRALTIKEKVLGKNDPAIAETLTALGSLHRTRGAPR